MGPETVRAAFQQFTDAPDKYKPALAVTLVPILKDIKAKLGCQEVCDDRDARIELAQDLIDEIEPFIPVPPDPGGGGGGGGS